MSLAALNLSPLSALTALVGMALWDLCLSHRCLYIDGGNMSDESSDSDSEPEGVKTDNQSVTDSEPSETEDKFYRCRRKMLPTAEEIEIASGRKVFTSRKDLMTFIDTCASTADKRQQTLRESFARAEKKLSPSARGIKPNSNNSSVSSPPRIRQGVAVRAQPREELLSHHARKDGFNLIGCLDLLSETEELLIDFQDLG
ncbi:hypothetical protein B0H11DRAFT_1901381 [Mycena galericulata]|nr:hypothetical protein B0H11DRAFT_1901381 [Mycena galericulata]